MAMATGPGVQPATVRLDSEEGRRLPTMVRVVRV